VSTSPLKSLTFQHLRGAVAPFTLVFAHKKRLTVIYGENGTGKTAVCDAFELLGRGKVGSLENRGLGRPAPFWPSLGKSSSDISVRLDTGDGVCAAAVQKSDVIITPAANRPRVEVLRRSQILDLVQAEASKRYAAIQRFIDVTGVEASERSLRDLITELNKSRDKVCRAGHDRPPVGRHLGDAPISPAEVQIEPAVVFGSPNVNRSGGADFGLGGQHQPDFGLRPDDLYREHESMPWNPFIANVFYRRGVIEQWGRGTLKIVELSEQAGLPRPEIEERRRGPLPARPLRAAAARGAQSERAAARGPALPARLRAPVAVGDHDLHGQQCRGHGAPTASGLAVAEAARSGGVGWVGEGLALGTAPIAPGAFVALSGALASLLSRTFAHSPEPRCSTKPGRSSAEQGSPLPARTDWWGRAVSQQQISPMLRLQ